MKYDIRFTWQWRCQSWFSWLEKVMFLWNVDIYLQVHRALWPKFQIWSRDTSTRHHLLALLQVYCAWYLKMASTTFPVVMWWWQKNWRYANCSIRHTIKCLRCKWNFFVMLIFCAYNEVFMCFITSFFLYKAPNMHKHAQTCVHTYITVTILTYTKFGSCKTFRNETIV
jgi:hypothetical protein